MKISHPSILINREINQQKMGTKTKFIVSLSRNLIKVKYDSIERFLFIQE